MQIRSNCDGHFGFRWSKMYLKTVELLFNGVHRIPGDFFVEPSVNQADHKVGQKMRNLSRCSYTETLQPWCPTPGPATGAGLGRSRT